MHAIVHPANIQDRDGGVLVLGTLFGRFPFLKKLFADGGYQGPVFDHARKKILPHLETEIVKRSDTAVGFEVIPRRWVVERTFAWLGRCRRLAKDFENRTRTARAFEPHKFTDEDIEIFRDTYDCGGKTLQMVDGEMISWYGSRAIKGLQYLQRLAAGRT